MDAAVAPQRERPPVPLLFGTILFLASELLFFGGLFATYFTLRAQSHPWPPAGAELDTALSAVATSLLIASSFTFAWSIAQGAKGRRSAMAWGTVLTMVLGATFVGIQIYDWTHLDFALSSHPYGTMYYAMTGFHALHVIAGLALMLVVLGRLGQGAYRDRVVHGPDAVAYYWHFVDVVWIGLFATLFLIR